MAAYLVTGWRREPGKASSPVSFSKGSKCTQEGSDFITNISPPRTAPLGIKASKYRFYRGVNIQSIAVHFLGFSFNKED